MTLSAHKTFILLLCIGLLAIKPERGCSLRRAEMALAPNDEDSKLVPNNRVLQGVSRQELNASRRSTPENKKYDPTQSSERRVRRGSDPIHNRS
ncbi:hypothetical protein SOVF_029830 [Spinacia oleracea]|nr:hypothetical protein SOVF_029830 [Spinacia oleracea]